jgi:hypothetical protein
MTTKKFLIEGELVIIAQQCADVTVSPYLRSIQIEIGTKPELLSETAYFFT